ncbi:MAG: UDP-N-acetylglucosamine 1-carboxyvinyltransferase [candidate division Zixibacteria bacterium]|nr:UDP-N-acetylglucosamine 1-carboxyvinyltransferase [candidate division Zixibacteria bacterium]
MDKFVIQGGKKLSGSVEISGAKNSVLPVLAAALLAEKGESIIHNVPNLADIDTMLKVLEHLGAKIKKELKEKTVTINAENLSSYEAPYDLVRKMRASFLVLGPLLTRCGKAKVSLPGGCVLGPRPVNLHLAGFSALGAKIEEEHGYVLAKAEKLKGNIIYFDRPSHTGTENVMMSACLAEGKTTLVNAACDPEVVDVANFLNSMGAKIEGAGSSTVQITGVKRLKGVEHTCIKDRLEAGTFMMAAAVTSGSVEIKDCVPEHLDIVIFKLKEMGVDISINKKKIAVKGHSGLKPVSVTTFPFPGFPTDMQASLMSLTCTSSGSSYIREMVFEDRFTHVMELNRLGADIIVNGDRATINGVLKLKGASVMASDIRAGAGLVLAGLGAEGETEVLRIYHIDRGYEKFEEKLSKLGAEINRVKV